MSFKIYTYKIQWLFKVASTWDKTKEENLKDVFNLVKILGARSFTEINFLNSDLEKVVSYNRMHQYPPSESDKITIKDMKQILKINPDVVHVEILRK